MNKFIFIVVFFIFFLTVAIFSLKRLNTGVLVFEDINPLEGVEISIDNQKFINPKTIQLKPGIYIMYASYSLSENAYQPFFRRFEIKRGQVTTTRVVLELVPGGDALGPGSEIWGNIFY